MIAYVVVTSYYHDGILGIFSSLPKAREAIMDVFEGDENITNWEDMNDYSYIFVTKDGEHNFFNIVYDIIDSAV